MESPRLTKIVATLGPASDDAGTISALLTAGVNVFRLNFSHGTHEEKAAQVALVRRASKVTGRPVAVMQDLQGPKIRVGPLRGGQTMLRDGTEVRIHTDDHEGEGDEFSVSRAGLGQEVEPGSTLFLADGTLVLRVTSTGHDVIEAEVMRGGTLRERSGVNVPGLKLDSAKLTAKDEADLRFGLQIGVDLVALSFVERAEDVRQARWIMRSLGKARPLIAKIERQSALTRIGSVVRAFDGVMVARGDLGVEISAEKVPWAQKEIIRKANELGKPAITATQMLESMTSGSGPTRAEASDVANAVLDGTDAVMLSGETAIGRAPVETVEMMDRIVREAEGRTSSDLAPAARGNEVVAFCGAAVRLARETGAVAVAVVTRSGRTVRTLAAQRPMVPVLALHDRNDGARALCLWRGVVPRPAGPPDHDEVAAPGIASALRQLGLPAGSKVVFLGWGAATGASRTRLLELIHL